MSLPRKPAAQRFLELKPELQRMELFCKGTVLARRMKCGQPGCPCHTDPNKRHGPYWEWTYKAAAKTVNVRLSLAAGPLYRAASQQYRSLKLLLSRLEKLSRTALKDSARQAEASANIVPKNRSQAKAPAKAGQSPASPKGERS
jgi:hypothetical protein